MAHIMDKAARQSQMGFPCTCILWLTKLCGCVCTHIYMEIKTWVSAGIRASITSNTKMAFNIGNPGRDESPPPIQALIGDEELEVGS